MARHQSRVLLQKDEPFSGDVGIYDELLQMSQPRVITVIHPQYRQVHEKSLKIDGDYQLGLCDGFCDNPGNAALSCFCPCVLSCKAAQRLDENCCLPVMCGAFPLNVRFRTLTGINQDMFEEACQFCCCPQLATLRLVNEMEKRNFSIERR